MRRNLLSRLPLRRVRVSGPSMEPTYREGDVLLVHWFQETKAELPLGSAVVIELHSHPGVFYIKRIQKSHGGRYWVEGDNRDSTLESLMNDSRKWGYISADEICGRVLFRIKRG